LNRLERKLQKLSETDKEFAGWRTLFFIFAFLMWCFVGLNFWPKVFMPVALIFSFAFFVTVAIHRKIRRNLRLFESRVSVQKRQEAIRNLDWRQIPVVDFRRAESSIPYLTDLNIVGDHSILRLMDRTTSELGFKRLVELFLSNDVTDAEIERRQRL